MIDNKIEQESFLSLFRKICTTGIGALTLAGTIYTLFSLGISREQTIIMVLSFWILGLILQLCLYLKKSHSIIGKHNATIEKCIRLKEKYDALFQTHNAKMEAYTSLAEQHRALARQFDSKVYSVNMIMGDIPFIIMLVQSMISNQNKPVRMKLFDDFKEALLKWERHILSRS